MTDLAPAPVALGPWRPRLAAWSGLGVIIEALEHIDALSVMLSEDQFKLQPIKIEDDPAAEDEPDLPI